MKLTFLKRKKVERGFLFTKHVGGKSLLPFFGVNIGLFFFFRLSQKNVTKTPFDVDSQIFNEIGKT